MELLDDRSRRAGEPASRQAGERVNVDTDATDESPTRNVLLTIAIVTQAEAPVIKIEIREVDDEQERRWRRLLLDETSGLPLLDRGAARYELDETE